MNSILSVGMEQSKSYLPTDIGPFFMTATKRSERSLDGARRDAVAAPKPRNKMKKDLCAKLSIPGLVLDPSKFKVEKLQEMASAQNIMWQKIIPNIEANWVGRQKGFLIIRSWVA
jgi:hypothetical protein